MKKRGVAPGCLSFSVLCIGLDHKFGSMCRSVHQKKDVLDENFAQGQPQILNSCCCKYTHARTHCKEPWYRYGWHMLRSGVGSLNDFLCLLLVVRHGRVVMCVSGGKARCTSCERRGYLSLHCHSLLWRPHLRTQSSDLFTKFFIVSLFIFSFCCIELTLSYIPRPSNM